MANENDAFLLVLCGFHGSSCSYKKDCRLKNSRELRLIGRIENGEGKKINIEEMIEVNRFAVAYRDGEFLLVFNAINEDLSDGTAFILPAKQLKTIADGLKQSGIQYQQKFNQDIGFTEE